MKGRIIYKVVLYAILAWFMVMGRRTHNSVFGIYAFITLLAIYIPTIINFYKKTKSTGPRSGLEKAFGTILLLSACGAFTGLLLSILHQRYMGHLLLNCSLTAFIIGAIIGIFAVMQPAPVDSKKTTSRFNSVVLLLCVIGTVSGVLLRLNHYPVGKQIMFGGLMFTVVFLLFLVVKQKYQQPKTDQLPGTNE